MSRHICVVSTLALTAAIVTALPMIALSAEKLSEKEACRMATAKFNADEKNDPFTLNGTNRNLKLAGCANFESMSDQGVAQIVVPYSFDLCNGSNCSHMANHKRTYNFYRTDQGWKIR